MKGPREVALLELLVGTRNDDAPAVSFAALDVMTRTHDDLWNQLFHDVCIDEGRLVAAEHLLFAALEDSTYTYDPHCDCYGEYCPETDIEVADIELGTSLSYFVSPGLAVGGRMVLSSGDRQLHGGARGGIGPEVTLFLGRSWRHVSPYVGAGYLYTRALGGDDRFRSTGGSVLLKSGIHTRINSAAGFYLQLTYHGNRRRNSIGERDTRWGVGFGYSGFF